MHGIRYCSYQNCLLFAIEESIKFGGNSKEFASKIDQMWQDIMKEYLSFSSKSTYIQAEHSGHYIHLTEPELIIKEAEIF